MSFQPPKPKSRPRRSSLWSYAQRFRRDILSAQPDHLFDARMAEFKTPFFNSFLINEPGLVDEVLRVRPEDFPKSNRIGEGLRPLLGESIFLTSGETWARQRRIIDPAFAGGRLRASWLEMVASTEAAIRRLHGHAGRVIDIEEEASHATADVIFRALFSMPIETSQARAVYSAFCAYQRTAPILNLAALIPLPRWVPRIFRSGTKRHAQDIRTLLRAMTLRRAEEIAAGTAPDDLATRIMTTKDPETGSLFSPEEMVDQVAIFFLAGHETSASALSWALYLLASSPEWQEKVAVEARAVDCKNFNNAKRLTSAAHVLRETMRLYPPVPMMVREATGPERFRDRDVPKGAQIVISPWHLHRHRKLWDEPDAFRPERWAEETTKATARAAYLPFSTGARVCPGAGFAMAEGILMLSMITEAFEIAPVNTPEPVAHLTVRSRNGIHLRLTPRAKA
ncbi:cytochrome P450 [Poseidonocella sedimentorum]|uniref:Cytochrome P450 n=1 Tax=Poseidonocella sedimentorum TaxID=871652 RepID=A0A1I6DFD3_9RHOB|nr:cytochrome P450 [Poseidonocella sedimentorum]SFR04078.1 Cytochrome P450 [Poseidonocella sedimentorum]